MSWAKAYHLYIDLNRASDNALVRVDESSVSPASASTLISGDARTLVLHFGTTTAGAWSAQNLTAGDTIIVVGKASHDGEALFSAESFTNDSVAKTYSATLDLNTVNLATAMAAVSSLAVTVDVEISGGGLIATFQFPVTVLKEIHSGPAPEIEGGPTYITADSLAGIISVPEGMRLRVTAEGAIVVEELE